jgi:hypothetical protein
MPTSLTLLDLAKMNGADGGLIELLDEAARATPELTGLTYRGTERRSKLPASATAARSRAPSTRRSSARRCRRSSSATPTRA